MTLVDIAVERIPQLGQGNKVPALVPEYKTRTSANPVLTSGLYYTHIVPVVVLRIPVVARVFAIEIPLQHC